MTFTFLNSIILYLNVSNNNVKTYLWLDIKLEMAIITLLMIYKMSYCHPPTLCVGFGIILSKGA